MGGRLDVTDDRWLTINQAVKEAGVSRRTIYNWYDRGHLTTQRTVGGSLRILRSSLFRPDAA